MTQRLRPVAVWRAGKPATVTEPHAWPNPEAVAMARPSWDNAGGLKDDTPPPPVNPLYANAVAARAEGLGYLADRALMVARTNGDSNPNMPLALTLATFGSKPQWLALPFCEAVEEEEPELLLLEDKQPIEKAVAVAPMAPGGLSLSLGAAQRRLIGGFALSDEEWAAEQARARQQLLCGCC